VVSRYLRQIYKKDLHISYLLILYSFFLLFYFFFPPPNNQPSTVLHVLLCSACRRWRCARRRSPLLGVSSPACPAARARRRSPLLGCRHRPMRAPAAGLPCCARCHRPLLLRAPPPASSAGRTAGGQCCCARPPAASLASPELEGVRDPAGGRPGTAPTALDGRRCGEWRGCQKEINKREKIRNRKIYKKALARDMSLPQHS
jgi:hypothetical protein